MSEFAPGSFPSCHQAIVPLWISKCMAGTATVTLILLTGVPRQHPRGAWKVYWARPAVGWAASVWATASDGSCLWVQQDSGGLFQVLSRVFKAQTWPGGRQWDFVYGWISFQLAHIYWWLLWIRHFPRESTGQWIAPQAQVSIWRAQRPSEHHCTSANPMLKLLRAWQT